MYNLLIFLPKNKNNHIKNKTKIIVLKKYF